LENITSGLPIKAVVNPNEINNQERKINASLQNNKINHQENSKKYIFLINNQDSNNKNIYQQKNLSSNGKVNNNNNLIYENTNSENLSNKSLVEKETQKLKDMKNNIYISSNTIENQNQAKTQKIPVNNSSSISSYKKINLNEHIMNNPLKTFNQTSNFTNNSTKENENNTLNTNYNINNNKNNIKNIVSSSINNPIINYINNTTTANNSSIKNGDQSKALNNFNNKRYNLKKFQTSIESKYKNFSP